MAATGQKYPVPIKGISCQELLRYEDVVHHGFLRRRSGFHKILDGVSKTSQIIRWPNIYVVLLNGCLYFFKDERSQNASKASSLYGFSEARMLVENELPGGVSWSFKVYSDLEFRDQVFYLCAPTESEMRQWITVLQQEINKANSWTGNAGAGNSSTLPASFPRPSPQPNQPQRPALPSPANTPGRKVSPAVGVAVGPKPPARPKQKLDPQLVYELDDGEFDSDYEEIVEDSDSETVDQCFQNQTDSKKTQLQNKTEKLSPGAKPNVSSPVTGGRPRVTSEPPATQPRPPVHQFSPPAAGTKPVKPPLAGKKPVATSPTFQTQPTEDSRAAYYSVERATDDADQFDEAQYISNEEYKVFTPPPTMNKKMTVEPLANNAMWTGVPAEGERFIKSLNVEGVYMIRASTKAPGQNTLLVKIGSDVRKYHISSDAEGQFYLESAGPHFDTLTTMIRHYRTNCLPCHQAKLTKSYVDFQKR